MRTADIEVGQEYVIVVRSKKVKSALPVLQQGGGRPSRPFPAYRTLQRVTVVDKAAGGVIVVEAMRQVVANRDEFPEHERGLAMLEGRFRYKPEPYRWTVSSRDVKRAA